MNLQGRENKLVIRFQGLGEEHTSATRVQKFSQTFRVVVHHFYYPTQLIMRVCFRCLACVSSVWRCNWCPLDQLCTHNHSCPNQHIILNQRVRQPVCLSSNSVSLSLSLFVCLLNPSVSVCLQESPGPTSCPLVFALQSSALVPLGLSTTVVLQGRNLDVYTVRTAAVYYTVSEPRGASGGLRGPQDPGKTSKALSERSYLFSIQV